MWVREREEMGLAIYYVQCWLKADKEWLCLAGCVVWMCVYICQYLIIMFGKNLKLKHSLAAVIWPVIELQVIGFVLNSSEINATPTPLPVELCLLAKISNLIQNRPFSLGNLLNNVVTGPIQDCGRALSVENIVTVVLVLFILWFLSAKTFFTLAFVVIHTNSM